MQVVTISNYATLTAAAMCLARTKKAPAHSTTASLVSKPGSGEVMEPRMGTNAISHPELIALTQKLAQVKGPSFDSVRE
jgi:hypothetical protein